MKKKGLSRRKFFITTGVAVAGLAVTKQGCTNSQLMKPNRQILENVDVLVVGGGPAGLASAIKAKESGIDNVVLVEHVDPKTSQLLAE